MKKSSSRFEPVIKWSGSKRTVAARLSALYAPAKRFFDPFVGSGAILPFRPASEAIAGDVIPELIALWRDVQERPQNLADDYEERWHRLQHEGHTAYYAIRESFNLTRNPADFLFLSRTCVNGLIRFNAQGEFNNSLHHTRKGIAPEKLRRVILMWSEILRGVSFRCADYRALLRDVREGDLVFLDPPYAATKGRYQRSRFDSEAFIQELKRLNDVGAFWVLTYDGRAGARSYSGRLPEELYKHRVALPTGHSPFTRLMRTSLDLVEESVYMNFDPPAEALRQLIEMSDEPVATITKRRGHGRVYQYALLTNTELDT